MIRVSKSISRIIEPSSLSGRSDRFIKSIVIGLISTNNGTKLMESKRYFRRADVGELCRTTNKEFVFISVSFIYLSSIYIEFLVLYSLLLLLHIYLRRISSHIQALSCSLIYFIYICC